MNRLRSTARPSAMRRCLFALLLVIVPFQFAWSGAAVYCWHQAGEGAMHFGHHDHKVTAKAGDKSHDQKLKQIADGDDDCIGCHINVAQQVADRVPPIIAVAAVRPADSDPDRYRSPTPPGLERPARQLAI